MIFCCVLLVNFCNSLKSRSEAWIGRAGGTRGCLTHSVNQRDWRGIRMQLSPYKSLISGWIIFSNWQKLDTLPSFHIFSFAYYMTLSLEQGILLFSRRGGGDELAGGQSVWPGQFSFEVICEVGLSTAGAGLQTAKKHHRLTVLGRQLNVSNFWPIQEIYGTRCFICFYSAMSTWIFSSAS